MIIRHAGRYFALLIGTIIGLCSQFIWLMLCLLWHENMPKSLINPLVRFLLTWTVGNVFIALLVYKSLCTMIFSSTMTKKEVMPTSEETQLNRVALQMEAAYASCTLVGIGFEWIIIYVLTNMTDKILPTFLMILMSLVAVSKLLVCKDLITRADEGKDCELAAETLVVTSNITPENVIVYNPPTFLNIADEPCIFLENIEHNES
jgi:hypothetical protein